MENISLHCGHLAGCFYTVCTSFVGGLCISSTSMRWVEYESNIFIMINTMVVLVMELRNVPCHYSRLQIPCWF